MLGPPEPWLCTKPPGESERRRSSTRRTSCRGEHEDHRRGSSTGVTASRMIMRTCSVLSIANSGAPFDSTCSARTSSPDDIRYQRIIRFTKFRDATRAAAFSGCPRNLVRSSGPIAARTSRRSFIFAPQPTVTLSRGLLEKAKKHRSGGEGGR